MNIQAQRLTPLNGEGDNFFDYDDGKIQAVVQTHDDGDKKSLAIYEWSSTNPEQGYSTQALEWLRDQFEFISVHGVGNSSEDPSAQYWISQAKKGRVDQIFLDDSIELNVVKAAKPKMG